MGGERDHEDRRRPVKNIVVGIVGALIGGFIMSFFGRRLHRLQPVVVRGGANRLDRTHLGNQSDHQQKMKARIRADAALTANTATVWPPVFAFLHVRTWFQPDRFL